MYELGLLDEFLRQPHQEVEELGAQIGDQPVTLVDFRRLSTHCKFLALMPQWDFLNFLTRCGSRYPGFHVEMEAEVEDLIVEADRVVGVNVASPRGRYEVRAPLTIGADG